MTTRIYVADLAAYNNGHLHGQWIDASTDVVEMALAVNAMLAKSPFPNVTRAVFNNDDGEPVYVTMGLNGEFNVPDSWTMEGEPFPSAEEFAIHDHEGFGDLGEYAGLHRVAELVQLGEIAETINIPLVVLQEFADQFCTSDDPDDIKRKFLDRYSGEFSTGQEGDWAQRLCEDIGWEVADWLFGHVNWDSVARDMLMDYSSIEYEGATYLFDCR